MRLSAQAAQRPASVNRGNHRSDQSIKTVRGTEEGSAALARRKKGTPRYLLYTLSPQAKKTIQELDKGSRYAQPDKGEDITYPLPGDNKIVGPLRPENYYDHLCDLSKQEGSGVQFQAMRQIGFNRFVPVRCGDNDHELNAAISQALAT